eukprot:871577_1
MEPVCTNSSKGVCHSETVRILSSRQFEIGVQKMGKRSKRSKRSSPSSDSDRSSSDSDRSSSDSDRIKHSGKRKRRKKKDKRSKTCKDSSRSRKKRRRRKSKKHKEKRRKRKNVETLQCGDKETCLKETAKHSAIESTNSSRKTKIYGPEIRAVGPSAVISKPNTTVTAGKPRPSRRYMVPMTPAEATRHSESEKRVRQVFDEDTGRYRLVRGNGEIIEQIVSKEAQKAIQKRSTHWIPRSSYTGKSQFP